MEIVNTQIGQNFAVDQQLQRQARTEPSQEERSDKQDSVQNVAVSVQQEANNAQASADSADTQSSEGQDRGNGQAIVDAVAEIESFVQVQNRNLAFSIDENTKRSVVTVKDSTSGDVIRQIPSEEVLRLAERIKDLQEDIGSSVGVLFSRKV